MNNWDMNDMNPIPISGVSQFFGTSKMNPMHFWGGFLYWWSRLKGWDYANPAAGSSEIVGAVQASRTLGFFASVVTQDGALPTKQQLNE